MKRKTGLAAAAAAAAVIIVSTAAVMAQQPDESAGSTIADRIYIGDVNVGGMTVREATDAVSAYVDSIADQEVTLKAGDRTVTASVSDLGLTWSDTDVAEDAFNYGRTGNLIARYKANKDLEHENKVFPVVMQADEKKTEAFLQEHADELNQEAQDYGLKRSDGKFTVVEGKEGIVVDVDQSVDSVNEQLTDGWKDDIVLDLVTEKDEPRGSAEELKKVKDELGTFHTDFSSSSSGRIQNIKTACSKINGTVLYPGDEFSVYDTIAPMDAEHGYELAGSYENGTTVQSYGGGVCQVSTTLYNAVIRAELEVTERYAHSMLVAYVDPSSDAAIAGTYKNLKFKNNTDAPVYIQGYTSGKQLYFTIYGQETRDPNREVSFESETTGTIEPKTEFRTTDAKIGSITKVQSSHSGKTARLWKIVTVNGVEKSREVFNNSTYNASPTIYEVGISSSSSEAVAAMKQAIATGDISKVRAAAAKWANADQKKKEETDKENTQNQTDTQKEDSETKPQQNQNTDSETKPQQNQNTDSETKPQQNADSSQQQPQTPQQEPSSGNSQSGSVQTQNKE